MQPVGSIFTFGRKSLQELAKDAGSLGIKEIWTTAGSTTSGATFSSQTVVNTVGAANPLYHISGNFLGAMVFNGHWSRNRNSSGILTFNYTRNVMGTNFANYKGNSITCSPTCATGRMTVNGGVTDELDATVNQGNWSLSTSQGVPSGSWCSGSIVFSEFTLVLYQGSVATFTRSIQGVNHTPQRIY